MSDVKKFAEDHKFKEGLQENDFFVFGSKIGIGTDSDHFQIGFTSQKLMSRIPSGIIFHCDATYKVVKLEFPLIVFGVSDFNRKFYPVAFMFTSYELNVDYLNFFKSLKRLCIVLNLIFDPKYMVIDAS